jgi:hypothetical protein
MGPGIYCVHYYPASQRWGMFPTTINKQYEELNKVYHVDFATDRSEEYFVYLDSTGHIPAYIRGANMIEKAIKNVDTSSNL